MLSPAIIAQRATLFNLQATMRQGDLPADIDRQIADAFGLPFVEPFSTSTDAALIIKDKLCPDRMILFRDYPGSHHIVDLEGESGEVSGLAPTRARAFIAALCYVKVFLIECGE